jgi:hypothetical protein
VSVETPCYGVSTYQTGDAIAWRLYGNYVFIPTNHMNRIERELTTVHIMIGLYCRANHKQSGDTCTDCSDLYSYTAERLKRCPHGNSKPACSSCSIHCYKKDMQDQIKQAMRFSGPRMIIFHPVLAMWHVIDKIRYRSD